MDWVSRVCVSECERGKRKRSKQGCSHTYPNSGARVMVTIVEDLFFLEVRGLGE